MRIFAPSNNAEIAQLVEHDLAKVGVASSSLVFRSKKSRYKSGFFLDRIKCLSGGIGRRAGLKILCPFRACRFDSGLRYEKDCFNSAILFCF